MRRPTEETWTYKKLKPPFATELYEAISQKFGETEALKPIFRFALNATSELGKWCADQVWEQALAGDVIPKLEGIVSKEFDSGSPKMTVEAAQVDIMRAKEACEIVKAHQFKHPLDSGQLSPKVELFLTRLAEHFAESKDKKCIVFTKRRNTAKTLLRLCEELDIPNLRPGVLVGARNSDITGNITFRDQFLVLVKFRQGEVNCLVSFACEYILERKAKWSLVRDISCGRGS